MFDDRPYMLAVLKPNVIELLYSGQPAVDGHWSLIKNYITAPIYSAEDDEIRTGRRSLHKNHASKLSVEIAMK